MKKWFLLFVIACSSVLHGQEKINFDDLQAIKNRNLIFYNLGGYSITTQHYSSPFKEKKLRPILREYKIKKKKTPPTKDPNLSIPHEKYVITSKIDEKITNYYTVYILGHKGKTSVVSFSSLEQPNNSLFISFIEQFLGDGFSDEIYADQKIDSIKYVNRYIKLGPGCHWMGVRNVQCPYNGQMDWTLHSSLQAAKAFNEQREYISTHQRKLKLVSKDPVNVIFEGKKTTALKVVYDVKGLNSWILKLQSGAEKLIVYYIAEEIDGKFVSCILSHWDNDRMQANGLPALLGEVMELDSK